MGIENLDAARTARVLEMFVALVGIILITPVFLPEQNKDIRDLVEAKYTSATGVTINRTLEAILSVAVLVGIYILILQRTNCIFPEIKYYLGTLAEAVFLGGMGLCAYSFFDQLAVAYMLPLMYYILAFGAGKKLLKDFYLFSMVYGGYQEKINLAMASAILILTGISYPYVSKRIIPRLRKLNNTRTSSGI
jgi:hypothetical protein